MRVTHRIRRQRWQVRTADAADAFAVRTALRRENELTLLPALESAFAALDDGDRLALFDPAVYWGDRETDLAMSELFGGFPDSFHAAYREAWPLASGCAQRKLLYQLYHVLNHLNLFGGGYLQQAERMISRLLAEIGG